MRQVRVDIGYPGATPEQVYRMLADPTFRDEVGARQRSLRQEVRIDAGNPGMTVRIDQFLATDRVPSFARRIAGDEIHLVRIEEWTSPTTAELRMEIPGKPGEMSGTITLTATDEGTVQVVDLAVTVRLPLIGGKAETFLADLVERAMRVEERTGQIRLGGSAAE